MTAEKIQPWKAFWVPTKQVDLTVEYGAQKGAEIIMDGGGGAAAEPRDPERAVGPEPITGIVSFKGQKEAVVKSIRRRGEEKTAEIQKSTLDNEDSEPRQGIPASSQQLSQDEGM